MIEKFNTKVIFFAKFFSRAKKNRLAGGWCCQYNADMRITYDPQADAMYIYLLRNSDVERTAEVAPGIMFDFDANGRVFGIEILDVTERTDNPQEFAFELLI